MKRAYPAWLDTAVFYEIYPQTFFDTNADGIGDLPGIIQKLDYIQSLGVTGLWLNPCWESPFQDAGYDVADYLKVAPRYGTNEDLQTLFTEAKKRGIRVLVDLVPGHTSVQHRWFKESAKPERNEYSDYYIWTDSGWTWDVPGLKVVSGYADRNASYITNFFYSQPALNFGFAHPDPHYPWQQGVDAPGPQAVRREFKNIMKFWLDKGASGFRVDMAASLVKGDPGHVVLSQWWNEIRDWLDAEYPEAAIVSEWSFPKEALNAGFHMDFYIHFNSRGYTNLFRKRYASAFSGGDPHGYPFFDPKGRGDITGFLDEYLMHYQATRELGFICIPTGNHDIHPRISHDRTTEDLKAIYTFLLTMPGVPFIYYGDEIGMQTVETHSKECGFERTKVRTPMQWDSSANAGFSTADASLLYTPVDPNSDRPTVATQEADPNSLLNTVRKLVALRQTNPALHAQADFTPIYAEAGEVPFVYLRQSEGQRILVAVNPAHFATAAPLGELNPGEEPKLLFGKEARFKKEGKQWVMGLSGPGACVYQLG